MKNFKKYAFLAMAAGLSLTACRNDDMNSSTNSSKPEWQEGDKGTTALVFNNTYNGQTLKLNETVLTSSNGQKHKFSELKYVVSNVVLTDEKGNQYKYFYNDSSLKGAHIINQEDEKSYTFSISDIPAGNYKQVTFGLGLHKDVNKLKEEEHPDFYKQMGKLNLHWVWATGYRFAKMEGVYGDTFENKFSVHTGSTVNKEKTEVAVDAYKEITLDLPNVLKVRKDKSAQITINADLNNFLSGKNKQKLGDGGYDNIHDAAGIPKYVENLVGMFSVKEVK